MSRALSRSASQSEVSSTLRGRNGLWCGDSGPTRCNSGFGVPQSVRAARFCDRVHRLHLERPFLTPLAPGSWLPSHSKQYWQRSPCRNKASGVCPRVACEPLRELRRPAAAQGDNKPTNCARSSPFDLPGGALRTFSACFPLVPGTLESSREAMDRVGPPDRARKGRISVVLSAQWVEHTASRDVALATNRFDTEQTS